MSARLNREELLARFDGDALLLREIATGFLTRSTTLLERLHTELARGATAEAGRTAHTLKGLIAYFDRDVVFDFARQLQYRADCADFAGAQALLVPLSALVEDLRDHLRKVVCDAPR